MEEFSNLTLRGNRKVSLKELMFSLNDEVFSANTSFNIISSTEEQLKNNIEIKNEINKIFFFIKLLSI